MINLNDKISTHFTWKEALWLHQWNRPADESDGVDEHVKANLEKVFSKLDVIRELFDRPITVNCAFRPPRYNKLIGGATSSAHLSGSAVDFVIEGVDCDEARQNILDNDLLEYLEIRMEDKPNSGWLHVDINPVIHNRFFKP